MTTSDEDTDRQVTDLKQAGLSYPKIAELLGITVTDARTRFQRSIAALPRDTGEEIAQLAAMRMDAVFAYTMKVMTSFHPLVNNGEVMINPQTGELIHDPVPGLAAAKLQIQAAERIARQYGTDAPRTVVNVTVDAIEQEIRRLESELGKAQEPAPAETEPRPRAIESRREPPPGYR
jgi:hypothetical protein